MPSVSLPPGHVMTRVKRWALPAGTSAGAARLRQAHVAGSRENCYLAPTMNPRTLLLKSFQAAVGAADPLKILPQYLPQPPAGKTLVVGAGKAAAAMEAHSRVVAGAWTMARPNRFRLNPGPHSSFIIR